MWLWLSIYPKRKQKKSMSWHSPLISILTMPSQSRKHYKCSKHCNSFWSHCSTKSCPATSAKDYDTAKVAGFQFEFSGSKTYWSTQETMCTFINKILVPYFSKQKAKLSGYIPFLFFTYITYLFTYISFILLDHQLSLLFLYALISWWSVTFLFPPFISGSL